MKKLQPLKRKFEKPDYWDKRIEVCEKQFDSVVGVIAGKTQLSKAEVGEMLLQRSLDVNWTIYEYTARYMQRWHKRNLEALMK